MGDKKSAGHFSESASGCALRFAGDTAADMLGRDPGDGERQAFAEHARSCWACGRAMHAWELVRGAWKAEIDRDEQYARAASERRLTALWPRRAGVPWPLALVAAATAALAAAWIATPRRPPPPAPRETRAARVNAPLDAPAATPSPTPHAIAAAARSNRNLLVVRSCAACGGLTAGESMSERGNVVVPRGTTLFLNWGIAATRLVDATSGLDVAGPAVVRADTDEGNAVLVLESGTAQAHVSRSGEVATSFAVTRGTNSTWLVAAGGSRTRVKVARGEVEVRTIAVRRVVYAGETLDAMADGRLVALAVVAAPARQSPARDEVPRPFSLEPAPTVSDAEPQMTGERASFALAEFQLAHGKTDAARLLLAPLLDAADPSLAGDAAFLLSGSMATPRQRLDVLDHYLAKARPSPYLEQAEIERARALLEMGQKDGARAIIRTLNSKPNLPFVVRAALARIERAMEQVP